MIIYSPKNIYLCDLQYLNAEIGEIDLNKKKQTVSITLPGKEQCLLKVRACPQGWHVIGGVDVALSDLVNFMETQFELRERFPYFCFAKIREVKMRITKTLQIVFFVLFLFFTCSYFTSGTVRFMLLAVMALLLSIIATIFPQIILRRTFKDYLDDVENDELNPMDFHDLFK